jgi:L-histidine N-alpha-methyltransferase
MSEHNTNLSTFAQDVDQGFSAAVKYISSKYFYDDAGDILFQKIMRLPEYYLTPSELEIFQQQSTDIIRDSQLGTGVQLIELGAGDGTKTKILLKELMKLGIDFTYYPIDISSHVLEDLERNIKTELGEGLKVVPVVGEYFEALASEHFSNQQQKFILFLGSTIGNFSDDDGSKFIHKLSNVMASQDLLLIGFDLKKNPQVIADVYNDSQGITRAFNMNLLLRINRELDANFDIGQFVHYPIYDPEYGAAKSYLVSKKQQSVYVGALTKQFHFNAGEVIFTEISRKYDQQEIKRQAYAAGLKIKHIYQDQKQYFADVLMGK